MEIAIAPRPVEVTGHGVRALVPHPWEARLYRRDAAEVNEHGELAHPVLHLANFALPPSMLALTPGDVVGLTVNGRRRLIELKEISDAESRAVVARSIDTQVFDLPLTAPQRRAPAIPAASGPAHAPRPASSAPATGSRPARTSARS